MASISAAMIARWIVRSSGAFSSPRIAALSASNLCACVALAHHLARRITAPRDCRSSGASIRSSRRSGLQRKHTAQFVVDFLDGLTALRMHELIEAAGEPLVRLPKALDGF